MRLVCVGDSLTVYALSMVGAEPVIAEDRTDLLSKVEDLLKNRNNIVLLTQSVAGGIEKELTYWQKKYTGSIVVIIPDIHRDVEIDANRLIAEVVGVNLGG